MFAVYRISGAVCGGWTLEGLETLVPSLRIRIWTVDKLNIIRNGHGMLCVLMK